MASEADKQAVVEALKEWQKRDKGVYVEAPDNQSLVTMLELDMSASRFGSAVHALVIDKALGRKRLRPEGLSSEGSRTRIWPIES